MCAEKERRAAADKFFQKSGEVSPKQSKKAAAASKRLPEEKKITPEYT